MQRISRGHLHSTPHAMHEALKQWFVHLQVQSGGVSSYAPFAAPPAGVDPMKEVIVLAACSAHELLPQSPELPADAFTACLTTPIKVCVPWLLAMMPIEHEQLRALKESPSDSGQYPHTTHVSESCVLPRGLNPDVAATSVP